MIIEKLMQIAKTPFIIICVDNCINRSIVAFPYIFIYNPIDDKEGKYRFEHLFFGFQFLFLLPPFQFAFLSLLCFAWLYLSMTRSRLTPLRPPISLGYPFGHWDAKLRLGLWRRCHCLCRFVFFCCFCCAALQMLRK